jgi:hypothetical protein
LPEIAVLEVIDLKSPALPNEQAKVSSSMSLGAFSRALNKSTSSSPSSSTYPVVLSADPKYPESVYAYHADGLHSINLEPWVSQLAEVYAAQSQEKAGSNAILSVDETLNNLKSSELLWLVNTKPAVDK